MAQAAYYELYAKKESLSGFDDHMFMPTQNLFAASKNDLKDELNSNTEFITVPRRASASTRVAAHGGRICNFELRKRDLEKRMKEMKKKRKKPILIQLIDRSNSFALKMKELEKKELAKKEIQIKDQISY